MAGAVVTTRAGKIEACPKWVSLQQLGTA